jgi:ribonuclease VapC
VTVLDASALLAFLQGEKGAEVVEEGLVSGAACGTANWSEVAQKIQANGGDWPLACALLASYDLRLEVVTAGDAEQAAETWTRGSGLSLADRLCLALGRRLDVPVLTADRTWGEQEPIHQIR